MVKLRLASPEDRHEVLRLVRSLLIELGGKPAPTEELGEVLDRLARDGDAGFVVIAEEDGLAKAVCTASFQQAIRTAGRYCILQEMYVEPDSRSSGIGREVIEFALRHAVASGCGVVELGTPQAGERQIRFCEREGFVNAGARMRWQALGNRYR